MLKASFRSFLSHKGRMVLSAIAVVLSVAFVSGTLIFADTITKTFDELFKSTAPDVQVEPVSQFDRQDLVFTGQTPTLPSDVVEQVRRIPGVEQAYGDIGVEGLTVVDSRNKAVGPTTGAPTIGVNWYVTDRTPVKLTEGQEPVGPDQALIDKDTADKKNVKIGDTLRVIAAPGTFEVKVVGILTFTTTNPGAALIAFDTPTAATKLLGDPNAITTVAVDAEPGVSNDRLRDSVQQALGAGYEVKTADEVAEDNASDIGGALDFIKYAMLGFAGIAVLVGVFLIFNTFSMLVAQRTRELGLMRAIGASRGDVNRSVLLEALLLGVIGSTLGFLAGLLLALGLKALISEVGVNLKGTSLVVNAATPITAYVVGVLVTVVAAYLPARRAGRVSPMAALREAGAPPPKSLKGRTIIGVVLLALGVFGLVGAVTADSGSTAGSLLGLGVVMTLIAFIILGPVLARFVVPVLSVPFVKMFGTVGNLSRENALRNPRRTGATASALMIGVALVGGLSVVASSMNDSIGKQIDEQFRADYTVQAGMGQSFNDEIPNLIRTVPGVGEVVRDHGVAARIGVPGEEPTDVTLIGADPGFDKMLTVKYAAGNGEQAVADGRIILGENWAKDRGLSVGSPVTVTFPTGAQATFEIGALREQEASAVMDLPTISLTELQKYMPNSQNLLVFVNAAPGVDTDALGEALDAALDGYPQVSVRDQADYKELIQSQINILLYMIYGLLGLAIIIAILGVVNTLALSVVERTREIGLMRAIGSSRKQIKRMIRVESTVIAVFGAIMGLVLGLSWGIVAQRLLEREGLEVLTVPWGTVLTVVIAAGVVGLLAALLPARRAARMNVLRAIATE